MQNNINFEILFNLKDGKLFATINKLNAGLINIDKAVVKVDNAFLNTVTNINKNIGRLKLSSIIDQVDKVATGLSSLNKPGMDLGTSLSDLSAITGVTGNKLNEIEGYARNSAKTFGGSAAEGVEAYKLILSQLNPEIAKAPKALQAMGNSVNTLSKTMGGNTVAATEVLTTAMNQFQVSTDDPIKAAKEMAVMMNVMAAGAKEGSAELPQIQQALSQSGMAAKMAKISFQETNAAIQVLDKAGKKGAEGGVALRNVMATLSEGRFLPPDVQKELKKAGVDINTLSNKSLTLADRLKPLKKIMNDNALVTKLFGKENSNAALAIISGIPEMERLTKVIGGTNTAYEQAAIIMESQAEKNKRLQASVDDFKISLFNASNGWMGYLDVIGNVARDVSSLSPLFMAFGSALSFVTSKEKMQVLWTNILAINQKIAAAATWIWNIAQKAFGFILALVTGKITFQSVQTGILTVAQGIATGATWLWTAAQTALNAAMKAFPLLLVIGLVLELTLAISDLMEQHEKLSKSYQDNRVKALVDIQNKEIKYIEDLANRYQKLGDTKDEALNKAITSEKKLIMIDLERKSSALKVEKNPEKRTNLMKDTNNLLNQLSVLKNKNNFFKGIKAPVGIDKTKLKTADVTKAKKTNEAIATGGQKHNYITINLKDLVGILNINGNGFKETTSQMQEQTTDAFLRVLNMANAVGA